MPYNDEQVQIIQRLEAHDGVVVQGRSRHRQDPHHRQRDLHYLALGKRVLVTSLKETGLGVLQEKLPEAIRPLAISLLTSEVEGMKPVRVRHQQDRVRSHAHRPYRLTGARSRARRVSLTRCTPASPRPTRASRTGPV